MPGIPVGPGTVFYLLAALAVPLVGRGRPGVARQVAVAVGMVCTGALSFWLFDRVGHMVDGRRAESALLLTSPLLIAVVVLAVMTVLSRVVRRLSR
jgi:apolipoprotein N-acyltransferase